MFNYHPAIKISIIFVVCAQIAYYIYLMLNTALFAYHVKESPILNLGVVFYIAGILFFADYYWRQKLFLIFTLWIILNVSVCLNVLMMISEISPPLYIQYSQSTALIIFSFLLLRTKFKFPNWLKIFSLAVLLVMIPLLFFYFTERWYSYEICLYIICFTPVIKSFVLIDERLKSRLELIDD